MSNPICKDCLFCGHDFVCLHDRAMQSDVVTGDLKRESCSSMRLWPCGYEGRFFAPINQTQETFDKEPF